MAGSPPRGTLGTIHNAAVVLRELATGPFSQQLTNVADRSQMSVPTVHRLLRSLAAAGLVQQDPRSSRYGLGPELVRLASHYLAGLPVLTVAGPYLAELQNATKGTVTVKILVREEAVTVDRIDGEDTGGIFRERNRYEPAHTSASGRVLLAHVDDERWEEISALLGDGAPSDAERRSWAEENFLICAGDDPGARVEIAAPVLVDGCVRAALAVIENPARFSPEILKDEVAPHLLRATRIVSRTLTERN